MIGFAATEFLVVFLFGLGGQAGLPLGMPPGPEDPIMAQFAPAECVFYTTWSPTATPDPEGNVTERWLAQIELQESFDQLKSAIREAVAQSAEGDESGFAGAMFEIAEHCMTQSVGFYLSRLEYADGNWNLHGGALIDMADDGSRLNEQLVEMIQALAADGGLEFDETPIDGSVFHTLLIDERGFSAPFTFGIVADKYLAVTIGEGEMSRLMANMQTDPPEWLTELRGEMTVDRVSSVCFVNAETVFDSLIDMMRDEGAPPEFESLMEMLGTEQIQTAGWVSGLDDAGFICRGIVKIKDPDDPGGLLGLLQGEPLEPEEFGRISDDQMVMVGSRISVPALMDFIRQFSDAASRPGEFDEGLRMLNAMMDIDFEKDVVERMDDHVYVYGSINFANPTAGWVLSIGASDEMGLTEPYNKIVDFIREQTGMGGEVEFSESEANGFTIYSLEDKSEWGFMPDFTWSLADGEMLISMDKSSLRRHLRRESMAEDALVEDDWFAQVFEQPRMDAEGPLMVTSLNVKTLVQLGVPMLALMGGDMFPPDFDFGLGDLPSTTTLTRDMKPNLSSLFRTPDGFEMVQRQTYPGGTPGTVIGAVGVGVVPAVFTVRRAAGRTDSANRMRQLVIAMHNYHDSNRALPARYSKADDGTPLLSWRVHILPFIGYSDLYDRFHLDEPWDSEHNRELIDEMPVDFEHPRIRTEDGQTVYLVATGDRTSMPDPEDSDTEFPTGVTLEEIADGTSRTIVMLEANAENAVTWTKPDDYEWSDRDSPVSGLCDEWSGVVNMGMADGSVQSISLERLSEIFKIMVEIDDGEVVFWDR
ncbi:MAG: DUF1559 domain-containing protein [Pirellulaceae bacterium]